MKSNKKDRTIDEGNSPVTGSLGETSSAGITTLSGTVGDDSMVNKNNPIFPNPHKPNPDVLKKL